MGTFSWPPSVATAPHVREILPSLLEFMGAAVVVGHNVRFDLSCLDRALHEAGRDPIANPSVDTLAMARHLVGQEVSNCQLATLSRELRLGHRPCHRALADVLATGDLLHALLELAGAYGITDLDELLELPRLLRHPQARKLQATASLPAQPGLFWFSDARGRVLFVDHHATSVRAGARSRFLVERDRTTRRLLREMHSVGHHCTSDEPSARSLFPSLIEQWDPPYNRVWDQRHDRRLDPPHDRRLVSAC